MKALCCIDPFENSVSELLPLAQVLRHLGFNGKKKLSVENVFVASGQNPHLHLAFHEPKTARLTSYPQRRLEDLATELWGRARTPLSHVLPERKGSLKSTASRLESYSATVNAPLVALLKSEKRGWKRGLMGSFAESVLDLSRRNLLIVPSDAEVHSRWQRILFPTDLSPADLEIFKGLAQWARERKIEICLFHVPPPILTLSTDQDIPEVRREVQRAQNQLEKSGEAFLQAAPIGLRLHIKISEDSTDIPGQILKEARRQDTDLVVMSSREGRLEKIFLGSISKSLVRHSKWPVLVLRNTSFLT